jgi:DNA (cytosine-5)-methyltransferase 1
MIWLNENNDYAARWLRNLIAKGHLPHGRVDDRSILDVRPADVAGPVQCHFFAGIGGWPYALGLAGWPRTREVWTASLPCQPLSVAGQRKGHADERHLWPAFHDLVAERRPATILGEQVASADGREWLAGIRADLEDLGYACGSADLCAAGAGRPQIRQRLYWVAHTQERRQGSAQSFDGAEKANCGRQKQAPPDRRFTDKFGNHYRVPEPGVPFLAHGFPGILDQIRAAGNAIVPQVAAEFIAAYLEEYPT